MMPTVLTPEQIQERERQERRRFRAVYRESRRTRTNAELDALWVEHQNAEPGDHRRWAEIEAAYWRDTE